MSKPMGDPVGFAILIGIIVGVGVLFMAFAIFYKFVVLDPAERWNHTGPELEDTHRRDTEFAGGAPQNPYPTNTVVPAPHGHGAYNDVELGEGPAFSQTHRPSWPSATSNGHQHYKPTASAVVPVVDAVLYESDADGAEAPHTTNPRRIQVVDVNATDARAQAMRDWYDN